MDWFRVHFFVISWSRDLLNAEILFFCFIRNRFHCIRLCPTQHTNRFSLLLLEPNEISDVLIFSVSHTFSPIPSRPHVPAQQSIFDFPPPFFFFTKMCHNSKKKCPFECAALKTDYVRFWNFSLYNNPGKNIRGPLDVILHKPCVRAVVRITRI